MQDLEQAIQKAAKIIKESDAILITAGAGMGVDSGLPDFRGTEGFWRAYPIAQKLGLRFEDMANPTLFDNNPKLAWGFYGHRLNLYRKTIPHKGFEILKSWVRQKGDGNHFVFTSNVDGQFQKAGFDEEYIYECHGSIHHLQCTECNHTCSSKVWSAGYTHVDVNEEALLANEPLPKCPECGSLARPNILMFSDRSWSGIRSAAQKQKFQKWIKNKADKKQKIAIIGLS